MLAELLYTSSAQRTRALKAHDTSPASDCLFPKHDDVPPPAFTKTRHITAIPALPQTRNLRRLLSSLLPYTWLS